MTPVARSLNIYLSVNAWNINGLVPWWWDYLSKSTKSRSASRSFSSSVISGWLMLGSLSSIWPDIGFIFSSGDLTVNICLLCCIYINRSLPSSLAGKSDELDESCIPRETRNPDPYPYPTLCTRRRGSLSESSKNKDGMRYLNLLDVSEEAARNNIADNEFPSPRTVLRSSTEGRTCDFKRALGCGGAISATFKRSCTSGEPCFSKSSLP